MRGKNGMYLEKRGSIARVFFFSNSIIHNERDNDGRTIKLFLCYSVCLIFVVPFMSIVNDHHRSTQFFLLFSFYFVVMQVYPRVHDLYHILFSPLSLVLANVSFSVLFIYWFLVWFLCFLFPDARTQI